MCISADWERCDPAKHDPKQSRQKQGRGLPFPCFYKNWQNYAIDDRISAVGGALTLLGMLLDYEANINVRGDYFDMRKEMTFHEILK